jgi:colanic acid biosynthesis glycosyl transferase WcaI
MSFPSTCPLKLLLASGRAIVASVPMNGNAAKAVEHSGGGIVVPPEDPDALAAAILELYYHPEKVKMLGEKSRQYALAHYTLQQALDQYEELFASVQKP